MVVLLSGGRDSVCLLDLAVHILDSEKVRALHVNYGLRDEADKDEAFCIALCREVEVSLTVHHAGRRRGGNLQAWAREERLQAGYELSETIGEQTGEQWSVASAHTASDQAETILYRLAASPGRRALLGMKPKHGKLIRPLLGITREQTTAYCKERKLAWRDDSSNKTDSYARNRVRNQLLPQLRSIHVNAESNVLSTAETLRDEAEVLDQVVDNLVAELGEQPEIKRLNELPAALTRLVMQRLADNAVSGNAVALRRQVPAILALSDKGGTSHLDVGGGLKAIIEYGRLQFQLTPGSDPLSNPYLDLDLGSDPLSEVDLDFDPADSAGVVLPVPGRVLFPLGGELIGEVGPDLEVIPTPQVATLDFATLSLPLTVRTWQPGDKMRPLGLNGTRSLHDLFIDRKIPRSRRGKLPIVLSGNEIVWIPGVAIGERFRIVSTTGERVQLRWVHSGYIFQWN